MTAKSTPGLVMALLIMGCAQTPPPPAPSPTPQASAEEAAGPGLSAWRPPNAPAAAAGGSLPGANQIEVSIGDPGRGKALYMASCARCHGAQGSAAIAANDKTPGCHRPPGDILYTMRDLRKPMEYRLGHTPRAVYRSIAYHEGQNVPRSSVADLAAYVLSLQRRTQP